MGSSGNWNLFVPYHRSLMYWYSIMRFGLDHASVKLLTEMLDKMAAQNKQLY